VGTSHGTLLGEAADRWEGGATLGGPGGEGQGQLEELDDDPADEEDDPESFDDDELELSFEVLDEEVDDDDEDDEDEDDESASLVDPNDPALRLSVL
jgi:hypothetical protein